MSAERARQYLNDPLIQKFEQEMREAIYRGLENANERDTEHLTMLCLMAKQRKQFMGYLQSFLDNEKVAEMNKQSGWLDNIRALRKK